MKMENSRIIIDGCPLRIVMDRFGDKWSILIIQTLGYTNTIRFNELGKEIEDISEKMLSKTLKSLELCGLVNREEYMEIPPRVQYSLTELGKSLLPIIEDLINWSTIHIDEINGACLSRKAD